MTRWCIEILAAAFVAALVLSWVGLAGAEPAGGGADPLAAARQRAADGECEAALEILDAFSPEGDAVAAAWVAELEVTAVCHLCLGRRAQAREAFVSLLELDPGHELHPDLATGRNQRFLRSVLRGFRHQPEVDAEVRVPPSLTKGSPLWIRATAAGATDGVARGVAYLRRSGEQGEFDRVVMRQDGLEFVTEFPGLAESSGFDYYVELQAPSGHVLVSTGASDDPLHIMVTVVEPAEDDRPSPSDPGRSDSTTGDGQSADGSTVESDSETGVSRWYATWWFWTIVGVVAASVTATSIVVAPGPEHEGGSLGIIRLPSGR